MEKSRTFTDANFEADVLGSDRPVLVDFWAEWCGPCRVVGPTVDELAHQFADSVTVGKLNVDDNPSSTTRFGIQSIPSVLLFQNGQVVETFVGVQPKERYQQALERLAA